MILRPRPELAYRLERTNDILREERTRLIGQLDTFKERAAVVEADLPKPKFTGMQTIIGAEGTPLQLPLAPAPAKNDGPVTAPAL